MVQIYLKKGTSKYPVYNQCSAMQLQTTFSLSDLIVCSTANQSFQIFGMFSSFYMAVYLSIYILFYWGWWACRGCGQTSCRDVREVQMDIPAWDILLCMVVAGHCIRFCITLYVYVHKDVAGALHYFFTLVLCIDTDIENFCDLSLINTAEIMS